LNRRPTAYKAVALPTELHQHLFCEVAIIAQNKIKVKEILKNILSNFLQSKIYRIYKKISKTPARLSRFYQKTKINFTYTKFHIFIVLFFLKAKISIITKNYKGFNMQFLPWAVILLLIYVIYFLMIRYEKKIATLSKMIEQNSDGIKENRDLIGQNRSLIEKNKHNIEKNTKDITTNVEKIDIDLED
jgi:hypothetical protein